MNGAAHIRSSVDVEDSWRRLGWIIPAAVLLWAALLSAFGMLLVHTAPPPPELAPVQVRIVEVPPPAGLQGGPVAAAPVKPKVEPVKPHPQVRVHRRVMPRAEIHHTVKPEAAPEAPPSPNGTATETSKKSALEAPAGSGVPGGSGSGTGSGIGSDTGGARAIYAPTPVIPDDLREQALQTVAVAHFEIGYDGQAEVVLTTPTESPRLNQILVETLKHWRFFPAMKNGVAINAEFDVRIPITVQ